MEKLNSPLQVDFIPMEYTSPKKENTAPRISASEHRKLFLNAIAGGHPIIVRTTDYHNGIKISLYANGYKYPNPNIQVPNSPYSTKSICVGNKQLTLFIPFHNNQGYLAFMDHLHFLLDTLFRGASPKVKALVISSKIIVKLQNQLS